MLLLPLLLALAGGAAGDGDAPVYHGGRHQTRLAPPRLEGAEAQVTVDGRLDEPAWRRAAVLTGFSQYAPVDGRPAADSTEVRVFYSPTAIHFGIRAFEAHGAVRATLADRDRIQADDYVEILLGTFNDRRQVVDFAVNPFGVQSDGTMLAGTRGSTGAFGTQDSRERPDLSADFVFQSKGHLTADGYEVEVRIPFKSLRYQSLATQSWSLNLVRRVQHSGYEDSWVPALQSTASFVAQAGALDGLHDLQRGLVLDLTPEVTGRGVGTAGRTGFGYDDRRDVGMNARWGVTNTLTMNAAANPDFSQVESDAGQFQFDPRTRIIYAEKRPFFLDGIEQFAAPFTLIHTRNIVQPVGAVKFTGRAVGTNVAVLGALDDRETSQATVLDGGRLAHPVFGVARLTRDLGSQSRVGLTLTHKDDGALYNSVGAADARFVLGRVYSVAGAVGGSVTDYGQGAVRAPVWSGDVTRSGRRFGFRYTLTGISEDFDAQVGAIRRGGVANLGVNHRVSVYGKPGARVESYSFDVNTNGTWKYRRFVDGRDAIEKKLHLNQNVTLRGGWTVGASALIERFGYDDDLYRRRGYVTVQPRAGGGADTVAFTGTPHLSNLDWLLNVATPRWSKFSGSLFYLWGRDENFYEWSSGDILWVTLDGTYRPTDKVRVGGTWQVQQVRRHTDGSLVERWNAPRVKLEYQIARPLFVRVVSQYQIEQSDSLRDDSRTGLPLYRRAANGSLARLYGGRSDNLRGDYLLSYTPVPGTVLYAGYGSTRSAFGDDLRRRPDTLPVQRNGLFVKASYLFRLN